MKTAEYTGHAYGEWETIRVVACLSEGQRSRTCTTCGYVRRKILIVSPTYTVNRKPAAFPLGSVGGERSRTRVPPTVM